MENKEIAALLKEIAVCKVMGGENPFKLRAFAQAARIVETYPQNIRILAQENQLTDVKGIVSTLGTRGFIRFIRQTLSGPRLNAAPVATLRSPGEL